MRAHCILSQHPSVYISSFNSIEALVKNYLAQSPSHSLSDPALCQEREGVLNRITVDKLTMKNRVSGTALSIELPSPRGDIYWVPVETSAGALGKSPSNQRTIDSGRPTAVTDQATALSTWLNQPEKGAMVQSLSHDWSILQGDGWSREGDHSWVAHVGYAHNHATIAWGLPIKEAHVLRD